VESYNKAFYTKPHKMEGYTNSYKVNRINIKISRILPGFFVAADEGEATEAVERVNTLCLASSKTSADAVALAAAVAASAAKAATAAAFPFSWLWHQQSWSAFFPASHRRWGWRQRQRLVPLLS
jgi:hypothetical protein